MNFGLAFASFCHHRVAIMELQASSNFTPEPQTLKNKTRNVVNPKKNPKPQTVKGLIVRRKLPGKACSEGLVEGMSRRTLGFRAVGAVFMFGVSRGHPASLSQNPNNR